MIRDFPLPDAQVPAVRDWLSNPTVGVTPRPASTVMLLRPASGSHPFEVYMVRRASTMAHTPGVSAFPGGSVRPDDDDLDIPILGPSVDVWAWRLNEEAEMAHRMLLAAAREVFEESGVLLAHGDSATLNREEWEGERREVEAHRLDFGDMLREHSLALDFRSVAFRGMWTTPDYSPRRYAVAFFTALLPEGQNPVLASSEATRAAWDTPAGHLERAERGEITLVAPTRVNLEELAAASSLDAALESVTRHVKFVPTQRASGEFVLRWET